MTFVRYSSDTYSDFSGKKRKGWEKYGLDR